MGCGSSSSSSSTPIPNTVANGTADATTQKKTKLDVDVTDKGARNTTIASKTGEKQDDKPKIDLKDEVQIQKRNERDTTAGGDVMKTAVGKTPDEESKKLPEGKAAGQERTAVETAKDVQPKMADGTKLEDCRITEATLERFMSLEADINSLTKDNVVCQMKTAEERLNSVSQSLASSGERLRMLQAKTAKEFQDVVSLKGASLQGLVVHNYEQQLSKEEQEYYAALNEQKIEEHKKKLLEDQYNKTSQHVATLRSQVDELTKKQEEHEELLCDIFDGDYGSEKEQELEIKVNLLVVKHGQVKTAHFRWSNARVLLGHAIKQMHYAISKWVEMRRVHPANRQLLYRVATESRNSLSASSQNVWSARQYIPPPLEVPYCNNEEMNRLNGSIATLYNNMLYPASHRAAYDLYVQMYHRMCLFHQWVSQVVNTSIGTELASLTKKLNKKKKKLLKERKKIMLCLIKGEKIDESGADNDDSDDEDDDKDESAASSEDAGDGHLNPDGGPAEADSISVSSQPVIDEELSEEPADTPNIPDFQPVPLSELAPPPSQDQVLGSVDELMKHHEEELEEFNRTRERNKARTEQDLKEKLRQRRSRKRKLQVQAVQEEMVKQEGDDK